MNKASAFRIKQADGTYGDPIVFGLDKSEVWPSTQKILANEDLNDYRTPGIYMCPQNTTAATLDNAPVSSAFSLQVYRTVWTSGGDEGCKQILMTYENSDTNENTNRIWVRTYYKGAIGWSDWYQIVTSMDRPIEYTTVGCQADTYSDSKMWHKVATFPYTHDYNDRRVVFTVTDSFMKTLAPPYGSVDLKYGILHVHIHRKEDFSVEGKDTCKLTWNLNTGYNVDDFVLVHIPSTNALELWTKVPYRYNFRTFNLVENANVAGGNRYRQRSINPIEMRGRVVANGQASYPSGDGYYIIKSEPAIIEQPSRGLVDLGVTYTGKIGTRISNANNFLAGKGKLEYYNSTSKISLANGAFTYPDDTSRRDAHVLRLPWDNVGASDGACYDGMLAVPNANTVNSNGYPSSLGWRTGYGAGCAELDADGNMIHTTYSDWYHLIDDRYTIDGVHVKKQHTTHYGVCSTAAATAVKTVDIPHFELVTGAYVIVKFTITNTASVGSLTLNVSGTGAKNIKYHNVNLKAAGDLAANQLFMFVYDGTYWQISSAIDRLDQQKIWGSVKAKEAITSGNIIVGDENGYFHLKSGEPFNISYPILFASSSISKNATNANVYYAYGLNINTTQSGTWTIGKAVFIKGYLNGIIFTPVSTTPLTQNVPSVEDGYQYLYLGFMYTATSIQILPKHEIYEYANGAFRPYQEKKYGERILARLPDTSATPDDADYLENLFAKGRILLQPNAHYHLRRTVILPENIDIDMNGATIEYNGPGWDGPDEDHLSDTSNYNYTTGCAFLNVRDGGHPASASDPDRNITAYNGRGNMRFYNGTFMNCAFGLLHGHDISFEDITFTEVHTNHVFQLCACKNVSFERCTFFGMDKTVDYEYTPDASNPIQSNNEVINLDCATESGQFIGIWFLERIGSTKAATWDDYACREIVVNNCTFRPNNDSIMFDAIGYHANFMKPLTDEVSGAADYKHNLHKNIRVTNNYFYGTKKNSGYNKYSIAFLIRHMMNSTFANNVCENVRSLCLIDHVRNITITGNVATNNGENYQICQIVSTSHNSTLQGVANFKSLSKYVNISGNLGLRTATTRIYTEDDVVDIANRKIYKYAEWEPNTSAYPRFSIDGRTVTLYGRVKATASKTISSEESIMCLPVGLRPATTVTWIQRIDTYGGSPANAAVLIKIFNTGELSITPIGGSVNVIEGRSDLWLDGTYLSNGASYTYGG